MHCARRVNEGCFELTEHRPLRRRNVVLFPAVSRLSRRRDRARHGRRCAARCFPLNSGLCENSRGKRKTGSRCVKWCGNAENPRKRTRDAYFTECGNASGHRWNRLRFLLVRAFFGELSPRPRRSARAGKYSFARTLSKTTGEARSKRLTFIDLRILR